MKRLSSVLLHYANFLRRAKGDVGLAELVLRKAAQISPTDSLILGNCAHFLAEESYGQNDQLDSATVEQYQKEASEMFIRAMKLNPSNVSNMLWYAKFLHKTNHIGQAEVMFKAALKKSNAEGKVGATALCNYAIFLYRHKKDPEQAAKLFCEGVEKFPSHRGIQKNYKAMKKELERATAPSHSTLPRISEFTIEEETNRGNSANLSSRMAGLRAKLYHDVQSADDYQLHPPSKLEGDRASSGDVEEIDENDDGMLTLSVQQLTIQIQTQLLPSTGIYWLMNAGSGSISDRNYESSVSSSPNFHWNFNLPANIHSPFPIATVTYNDHLCFEFFQIKFNPVSSSTGTPILAGGDSKKGTFFGSVILPIEDIIHSTSIQSIKKKIHHVEETIMSDEGEDVGQIQLHFLFS